jgi:hypothetical protein
MTALTKPIGGEVINPGELLDRARARLDTDTTLMQRLLDLREILWWGVLDLDQANTEVAALKRDVARLKRERKVATDAQAL